MKRLTVYLLVLLLAFAAFPGGTDGFYAPAKAAAPTIVQINVGLNQCAAVMSNGDLYAWQPDNPPFLENETGFTQVSIGAHHMLAIRGGGLYAQGHNGMNNSGQVGIGTNEPVWGFQSLGTGFTQVAAGGQHSLALKGTTLYAWGRNENGQLGDGTTTDRYAPKQIGTGFTQIAAGDDHSLALKGDTLYMWGCETSDDNGGSEDALTPVSLGTGFTKIAAGGRHSLALKGDELYAWGRNSDGQLGDDTVGGGSTPALIGSGYSQIAAGRYHSFAIKSNGELYGWGDNASGQLGDGTKISKMTPKLIGTGFTQIATASRWTLGLKGSSLYVWGDLIYGEKLTPTLITFFDTIGQTVATTGVTLDIKSKTISAGATFKLTATVSPTNATNKSVWWSSSDNKVATVSSSGLVEGIKAGNATITVNTADGGKTATCAVTVKSAASPVTSISIPQKSVYLKKGASATLAAVPITADGSKAKLTWKSDAPKTVSVDPKGKVKALKAGKATITVTADNGKSTKITVNVGGKAPASVSIKNPPKNKTMKLGATLKLSVTVKPSNAQGVLTFKSSDKSVISVDAAGQLKALKKNGSATITVTLGGKKTTLKITVK